MYTVFCEKYVTFGHKRSANELRKLKVCGLQTQNVLLKSRKFTVLKLIVYFTIQSRWPPSRVNENDLLKRSSLARGLNLTGLTLTECSWDSGKIQYWDFDWPGMSTFVIGSDLNAKTYLLFFMLRCVTGTGLEQIFVLNIRRAHCFQF